MAESKTKVRVPNPPIEQSGSQDGLPQPTVGAVLRVRGKLLAPEPTGRKHLAVGQTKLYEQSYAEDETSRLAAQLAAQGITNPTFENIEEALAQLAHEAAIARPPIPPLPAQGEQGVTPHTRNVLQAAGTSTLQPSKADVVAVAAKGVEPSVPPKVEPKDFDYKLDLPYNAVTAAQVLNYMPPEFRGIHAATDVNGRPIEGEWVDVNGEHLDPTLEQKYEDYLTKRDIALQIWEQEAKNNGTQVLFQAQQDYLNKLKDEDTVAQQTHDDLQAQIDRDIAAGNLTKVNERNTRLDQLDKEKADREKSKDAFTMIATIAAHPEILFYMKQSGILQTLVDQFGLDLSMFMGGSTTNNFGFNISDLARMSPIERRQAIGKVSAATGKSEADIMEELRKSAPGGQSRPQQETL